MTDDAIVIELNIAIFDPRRIVIRIEPEIHLAEADQLLSDSDITFVNITETGGSPAYFGLSQHAIELLVTNAAAWTAVAGVLKTFINRHRNKKIKFNDDGEIIEIDGYSSEKIRELLIASRNAQLAKGKRIVAEVAQSVKTNQKSPSVDQSEQVSSKAGSDDHPSRTGDTASTLKSPTEGQEAT